MSLAWQDAVALWREPWRGVAARLGRRAVLPAVAALLAGIPGTGADGVVSVGWLRAVVLVVGALGLLLWVLALLNLAVNRRVLLRRMPTGTLERPRSLQERALRIPIEWVGGPAVEVAPMPGRVMVGMAEPRVNLTGDGKGILGLPLYGADLEEFAAWVNEALEGRGPRVVVAEPEPSGQPGEA